MSIAISMKGRERSDLNRKGNGIYLLTLLIAICLLYYLGTGANTTDAGYTEAQFYKDLQNDKVSEIVIEQNQEVPTGNILVKIGDSRKEFAVSDVNDFQEELKAVEPDVKYSLKGINHSMDWIVNLVPNLLLMGMLIFMMVMIMRQNGGSSKMADFGKSRAKLAKEDSIKVTFADVAGLD